MEWKTQDGVVELHNVEECEPACGMGGVWLQRYPRDVRIRMGEGKGHEGGRFASRMPTGCEIRFVTSSPAVRILLSLAYHDGDIIIYTGDWVHSVHHLEAGKIAALHLEKIPLFDEMPASALANSRFPPQVWRILFSGRPASQAILHEIDSFGHPIRAPLPAEKPSITWLAYGSSITNGSGATLHHNAYIQQAARRLSFDLLNKGLGGSCLIEKTTSDYLARMSGWDLATLELGINMVNRFTSAEFEERAVYLVESMIARHPDKSIVLITMFPNASSCKEQPAPATASEIPFNTILHKIHLETRHPRLHLLEGSEILTDFSYLTTDGVHPSDFGHIMMGQHLAELLSKRCMGANVP